MKKWALTLYVLKNFAGAGFTRKGDIKVSVLKKLKNSRSKVTRSRANFALNNRKKGERVR